MASNKAKTNATPEVEPEVTTNATPEVKMVKIRVPRLRKNEGDLTVGHNGVMFKIKRGVEVEVPDYVAQIIADSEKAMEHAYSYQESVVSK